ncbi:hypothetical protein M8J77_021983 [Diaphorina citri]|nr:hypothetical protein M8J77_021983 [Diaphorina citri]
MVSTSLPVHKFINKAVRAQAMVAGMQDAIITIWTGYFLDTVCKMQVHSSDSWSRAMYFGLPENPIEAQNQLRPLQTPLHTRSFSSFGLMD